MTAMRIRILTVGKVRQGFVAEGEAEYRRRLRGYAELEIQEVVVKAAASLPEAEVRQREGEELLARLPAGERLIVLDEKGRAQTSRQFADVLAGVQRSGAPRVTFVIGGASGLDERVRQRAEMMVSLSALTLPHQLARLVLVEQIYRACTILRGEPYHRG